MSEISEIDLITNQIAELDNTFIGAFDSRVSEIKKDELRYYLSKLRSRFSHVLDKWIFSVNGYEKALKIFTPHTTLPDGCILCIDRNQIVTAILWECKSVRENGLFRDYIEQRIMSLMIFCQACAFSPNDGEEEIRARLAVGNLEGEIRARFASCFEH